MNTLENKITKLLKKPLKFDELKKYFPQTPKSDLINSIKILEQSGTILKNKKNRYALAKHYNCIKGTFLTTSKDFSFVEPEEKKEGQKDIYIPKGFGNTAWHGDKVLVKLYNIRRSRKKTGGQDGEVIKILSRNVSELTGSIQKQGKSFIFLSDFSKYPKILIPKSQNLNAQPNDKVAIKILSYGDKKNMPKAMVTKVFGKNGEMEASISAILHENGIKSQFPEDVLQKAKEFGNKIPQNSTKTRKDLTKKLIFTIDGDSAKDFDDAVSVEILKNGNVLLGVHIADVSHYVTPNDCIDIEAFSRGTSVYYPSHVIPMLPFELSAGLCSLRPNEERLAFSVFIELKPNGEKIKSKFFKSVICSKARMTYNNVNKILDGNKTLCEQYKFLKSDLVLMSNLANVLHQKRISRGALELDIPEPEIQTDENGNPINIFYRNRGRAEKMIEEFMLIANECVAEFMNKNNFPAVYRVHENPDPEKLKIFADFAKQFGHKIDISKPNETKQFQTVLNEAKKDEKQSALPTLLLRSLARAKYCDQNLGHYGLQAKYYLHFTSPIRRYPDLITHRMLTKAIENENFTSKDVLYAQNASSQSTAREMAADTAERSIDKLYIAAYMEKFIGQIFNSKISGVQSFGVFVELENSAEGLVRIEQIKGYYEYDEQKMQLKGNNGINLTIGTKMCVQLVRADRTTGQIDFIPVY